MRIISGIYKNQILNSPKGKAVRPTSEKLRASLFNICQNEIEGAHFLDLFAGSGAMGLEALSRGAASATFIEADKLAAHCIQKNVVKLAIEEKAKLLLGNAMQLMKKLSLEQKHFDIIFADPPYESPQTAVDVTYNHQILTLIDSGCLLSQDGQLFLEDRASEKLKLIDKQLKRLYLKSVRQFGDSLLRQYLFTPSSNEE